MLRVSALSVVLLGFASACAASNDSTTLDAVTPIPHSTVATANGKGIVGATLSCATSRYAHGVLGDSIEAGCLVLVDDANNQYTIELPETQVFEDLDPRIADVDGDGRNDVVVIRSNNDAGAAIAIYTIINNAAIELASTPPIGLSNRWLAPIGIADFNNDGKQDVAYIQTPHIGGILKVWTITDNGFEQIAEQRGYSNHSIGSTRVSTAKLVDYNEDGVMDMALPDQSRRNTVWVSLVPELRVLDTQPYDESYFD